MGELHGNPRWYAVGKLELPPIVVPRVRTRNVLPTRFYAQYLSIAGTSGDKPQVFEADRHQPAGNVSPTLLTQDWQLNDNVWQPLGPVSEISLTKQPVLFKIDGSQPGFNKLNFVVELPEWSQMGGLPAAVYMGFKVQYPGQQIVDQTDAWKCLIDLSNAFDDGVSVANVGSYINGWAVCYVMRIWGNLLKVAQNLHISVEIDAYFKNETVIQPESPPGLGESPVDMTFTLSGEVQQVLPIVNPAADIGTYGWEIV